MTIEGSRVLVVGMEKSGRAAFEFLHARGADVTPTDLKPQLISGFRHQSEDLFDEFWDLIVISPGVPVDLPGLVRARSRGIDVIGEVELAAPWLRGPVIGITGTNGKTTTTSLIGHILQSAGLAIQVGGNIGTPVIAMTEVSRPGQWNVLELSSFQLETIRAFRANVAICLNVTQNHLDRHHTFENYAAAKGNLFRTQKPGDYALLNRDDEICRSFAALTPATVVWFSGNDIAQLLPPNDVPIPGRHNAENVMAAAAAARIAGVAEDLTAAAVKTFHAVEHRLEFVAEINGVRFYNDSKATSVDATSKAIDSFPGNLWVILGGKDKGSDYTELRGRLHEKARAALLIGSAAAKIESELKDSVPLVQSGTLGKAVAYAWTHAAPGDTVLLAPACASFDQFDGYEHRGQAFKDLINEIKHGTAA